MISLILNGKIFHTGQVLGVIGLQLIFITFKTIYSRGRR